MPSKSERVVVTREDLIGLLKDQIEDPDVALSQALAAGSLVAELTERG